MSERISVCAPYWQRQAALDQMCAMYARLYPHLDLELSICDDGSPEPAIVPDGVLLTRLPTKDHGLNPCVPINRAVDASTGDWIVLTNPECEHPSPVLDTMLALRETEDDYITARCWDVDRRIWLAGELCEYGTRGRMLVPKGAHFHFLALFHRSLWERAGGFDEAYRHGNGCDDNDWLWRVDSVGARFKTAPVTVHHRKGEYSWGGLPSNRGLLFAKWPHARP